MTIIERTAGEIGVNPLQVSAVEKLLNDVFCGDYFAGTVPEDHSYPLAGTVPEDRPS